MALSSRSRLPPFAVLRLALSLSMTCLASSYYTYTAPWQCYSVCLCGTSQVDCHDRELVGIPTFANASEIQSLDLSGNQLGYIKGGWSIGFGRMRNLYAIDMDNNRIESIEDGTFTNMTDLQHVYVDNNRLRQLPNSIPASVKILSANFNQIQRISPSIFAHDSKMEKLFLKHNSIAYLAANTFSRLTDLSILYLDNNKIQVMSQMTYFQLQNLEELSLHSNPVREVETGALAGLSGLIWLDLSEINGEVTGIAGDTFRNTPSLTNLDLHGSPNLVTLILNNTDVLRGLSSLTHLNLMENNLKHLDADVLSWFPNVENVKITDNPWQCDEKLLPLRRALEKSPSMFPHYNQIICQYPEYLSGIPVIKLKYEQFTPMTTKPTATTTTMTTSTTPSSPTPASESATIDNTDGENTTNDTTMCLASSYTAGDCYTVCYCCASEVDCHDRELVEIPAFMNPSQIRRLNLSGNQLEYDIDGSFKGLTSLEYLDLSSNRLVSISTETFSGLHELSFLSLSNNQLTSISHDLIRSGNLFQHYSDNIWGDLFSLSSLKMSSCQLMMIPRGLPLHLKHLDLRNNSLTFIAEIDFKGMFNLISINLDDNRIKLIETMFLPALYPMSHEEQMPEMIKCLIPASVEVLTANNNQIQRVSTTNFAHDSKMKVLSLKNNSIANLAAYTFSRISHLRILHLDHNKIQVMSQRTYSRLQNLEELSLDSNPVREIETGALAGLSRLSKLMLSEIKGEVTGITGNTFRNTPSLTNLDLHGSPNLVTLILNNTDVLRGLSSLTHLNLMNTNLTHLDVDVLSWLPKLKNVALMNNPWQCDDKLLPLRRALEKSPSMFTHYDRIICQYPEYLSGIPVIKLKYEQFTPMTTKPTATTTTMTTSTTPSSPTPASESATIDNTDGKSTTIDTTMCLASSYTAGQCYTVCYCCASEVDCHDRELVEIPAFMNRSQIRRLNLSGNQLEYDIDGSFKGLTSLEYLDLSSNRLVSISTETFSGLHELSFLSLSDNQLTSISHDLIRSDNPFQDYSDNIWRDLFSLSSLKMSSCQLMMIPRGLPLDLKHLDLRNNSLTFVAKIDFIGMFNLISINLDDNRIKLIETRFLPAFHPMSHEEQMLETIKYLIPGSVEVLTANNNQIQRVSPTSFAYDSRMKVLSLKNNSIANLAANTFSRISNLRILHLDHNKIQVMSQMTYSRLQNLEELSLDSNPVREIETGALAGLSGLSTLMLSEIKGEVTGITGDTFRNTPSLTNLDLHGSPNLVTLILNNTDVLRGLSSLTHLNLMNTNLTHLDVDVLSWLPTLKNVALMNNPWQCDDKLLPLRRALEKSPSMFPHYDRIICQYPEYLSGIPVIKLKYEQFTPMTTKPTATTTTMTTSTTPSSPTPASESATMDNTDGESTTNDTTMCLASSYTAGQCYTVCYCCASEVDCHDRELVEIPAFTNPSQIRRLNLSGNQLEYDIDGSFKGLTSLEYLDLSSNRLVSISTETFSGLHELSFLSLSNNQLTSISHDLIRSGNLFQHYSDNIWRDLFSLSSLKMSSCQLMMIPRGLPLHLKHLDLRNNSLTFIAEIDFKGMFNLISINLDDNRIKLIETRFLPAFHPMFHEEQMPEMISFAYDSKMKVLSLKNNSIANLAAYTFSRISHLRILHLDHNKIQVMSQMTYFQLQHLEELSLDSNPVREIETGALAGLSGLSTLMLSEIKGEVTGITGDTFRNTPSLTNLDLHGSPNLVTLILNNTDVLRGLSSLTHLNLMNTNLTHLDVDVLSWLPKLKNVALMNNPWQCDDKLLPLRQALEKSPSMFQLIDEIICQYPEHLSGTPVITLKYEQFTPMTTKPTATTTTMTTSTTPSSPTPASESATIDNTDRESTTIDTTSRSLSSTVTTERSTSTSGSPSKTLLSSTTARSMTTSTTPSSSLQTSASATNENTDGESATDRSKKDDHTKAMIIGVSVSLMVLAIVTIAIIILIRSRRERKRFKNGHQPYSFKQEYSTASDTVLIFTHANGPETNPGSHTSIEYKDISDGDKHSGSQETGCPRNPKNQNDAKHKNSRSGMNCFISNSRDDSEILIHACDEAHH